MPRTIGQRQQDVKRGWLHGQVPLDWIAFGHGRLPDLEVSFHIDIDLYLFAAAGVNGTNAGRGTAIYPD